jgi:hypothetical protein
MTFRVGTNCILLETVLDSNFEPIIHAGERVEIFDPDYIPRCIARVWHEGRGERVEIFVPDYMPGPSRAREYFGIRNKIDERAVVHRSKLRLARGRPMRILR